MIAPALPFAEFAHAFTWNGRRFVQIGATVGERDADARQFANRCEAALSGFSVWSTRTTRSFDDGKWRTVVELCGPGRFEDTSFLQHSD